jgi:hypothetical protein
LTVPRSCGTYGCGHYELAVDEPIIPRLKALCDELALAT